MNALDDACSGRMVLRTMLLRKPPEPRRVASHTSPIPPRARRLDKTYLPSSPPGCSASLCVLITISYSLLSDYDFDAASIVSETANARHFLRARGLAGHGLHDAGNDAA